MNRQKKSHYKKTKNQNQIETSRKMHTNTFGKRSQVCAIVLLRYTFGFYLHNQPLFLLLFLLFIFSFLRYKLEEKYNLTLLWDFNANSQHYLFARISSNFFLLALSKRNEKKKNYLIGSILNMSVLFYIFRQMIVKFCTIRPNNRNKMQ